MLLSYWNGIGHMIVRFKLRDTTLTNNGGKTGILFSTAGLIISTIADNENAATAYTQAGSTIETVTTIGTYAAPTATKCRFKEIDATNHPGLYELQIADARWGVSGARYVIVTVSGVTGVTQEDGVIQLPTVNAVDATNSATPALPNAASNAAGGLPVSIAGGLDLDEMNVDIGAIETAVAALPTAAAIATAIFTDTTAGDFTVGGSIGKSLAPAVLGTVPGAAGGLVIAGTNAATSFASGSHFIGTVDTLTTYTGNTLQTGDSYARLGAPAGASIAADIAEIEAETDTITANVAPAAIATAVWTDTLASDFTVAASIGKSLVPAAGLGNTAWPANFPALLVTAGGHITIVDTLTTYTSNTPQTGDSFARLGAPAGASIAADLAEIEAETDGIAAIPTTAAPANWGALLITAGGHISNVDTLTTYTGNTLQTGDSYLRLGAPAGASIAADIAEVEAETDGIAAIPTSNPTAAAIAAAVMTDVTDTIGADVVSLLKIARADLYTDTSTDATQWHAVYMLEGSGGIGVGTVLMTKKLNDVTGVKLTSTTTTVGQQVT
ncbi:MAG TPA: hypothetical protein VGX76_05305 [Pirellulales bacterium]|nr:hypothetical protein [Pirellulales bacterium]